MPTSRPLHLHLMTVCVAGLLAATNAHAAAAALSPEEASLLAGISADSMRGHLSFLASDALEGRGTPSRGLDIAAEYIAAQFRRAGLEPLGDDGYFQTADWREIAPAKERARHAEAPAPLPVRNVAGSGAVPTRNSRRPTSWSRRTTTISACARAAATSSTTVPTTTAAARCR